MITSCSDCVTLAGTTVTPPVPILNLEAISPFNRTVPVTLELPAGVLLLSEFAPSSKKSNSYKMKINKLKELKN